MIRTPKIMFAGRLYTLILMALCSLEVSATERVLTDYVKKYNSDPTQEILLRNIRTHDNLWSGWIDSIKDGKHTWGTFIALIDEGEVTYWYTDETSNWLGGDVDGAEAGQAADTIASSAALLLIDGAVELNPLGLPLATVLKYAMNNWAEKQDFNTCVSFKRKAGRQGWALSGWAMGSFINPIAGAIAAMAGYNSGGELTDDTVLRGCQNWIGPVVINQIPVYNPLSDTQPQLSYMDDESDDSPFHEDSAQEPTRELVGDSPSDTLPLLASADESDDSTFYGDIDQETISATYSDTHEDVYLANYSED